MIAVGGTILAPAQTPPPAPNTAFTAAATQEPTTTVVGADGRMVSLIFLRADAENVTRRIYDALLDRDPARRNTTNRSRSSSAAGCPSNWPSSSKHPSSPAASADWPPADVLNQIFRGMLDRAPTAAETKTYLPQVQTKQYVPAMLKLVTSDSFRKQVAQDRALSGRRADESPDAVANAVPERPERSRGCAAPSPPPTAAPPRDVRGRATSSTRPSASPRVGSAAAAAIGDRNRRECRSRRGRHLGPRHFRPLESSTVSVPSATRPALTSGVDADSRLPGQRRRSAAIESAAARSVAVRRARNQRIHRARHGDRYARRRPTPEIHDARGAARHSPTSTESPDAPSADTDFSNDAVKACHAAVIRR